MSDLPFAKKSLGQHWLHDVPSLEAMCDAAGVHRNDTVLEIGPGTGTLSKKLLERGAAVIALEYDNELIKGLQKKFDAKYGDKINIQTGDIRTYDLTSLPSNYKITANIPYYLTAHLLRILADTPNKPARSALLVQKEVAERVAAGPGSMSFVSLSTQLFYEVYLGWIVPAHLFTPPPKVDSRILILKLRDEPLFPGIEVKQFFRIAKAGFSARRKTLLNSLAGGLRMDKNEVEKWLQEAGIDPMRRPQELSLQEWFKLYQYRP